VVNLVFYGHRRDKKVVSVFVRFHYAASVDGWSARRLCRRR
jgi:hypothetical protein